MRKFTKKYQYSITWDVSYYFYLRKMSIVASEKKIAKATQVEVYQCYEYSPKPLKLQPLQANTPRRTGTERILP